MITFKRDSNGIQKVLNDGRTSDVVAAFATQIAESVSVAHPDAEVVVDRYTTRGGNLTPRAAASVAILDVRGRIWQVRDGVLTKAAAAAGLEVAERD